MRSQPRWRRRRRAEVRRSRTGSAGVLATAALVSLSACSLTGVNGSGTVVEATPQVDSFEAIDVDSAFAVTLRVADDTDVVVRADDNVIDAVVVDVDDGVLGIRVDRPVRDATLEADVSVPADAVQSIDVAGASTLTSTDTMSPSTLEISVDGAGRAFVVVDTGTLTVSADGAGVVNASGEADGVVVDANGASSVQLPQLRAGDADVSVDGASRVDVNVEGELTAQAAGASTITYTGDPASVDQDASGASTIRAE